jgi:mono/diheme cytochrome c family protein
MTIRKFLVLSAVVLLLFILAACAGPNSPNTMPETPTPIPTLAGRGQITLVPAQGAAAAPGQQLAAGPAAGDPAEGPAIFENRCTECHGLEAQGGIGLPLRNSAYIQNSSIADIYNTIANGRSGTLMPAWLQANGGPLISTEIDNIVAYLKELQGVAAIPRETIAPTPTEVPATPGPAPAGTPEPARPSVPGGPGQAISLTGDPQRGVAYFGQDCAYCHGPEGRIGVPNLDSDDGVVPNLNPIDETLINKDPKVFATNLDLFIEHGSIPSGTDPHIKMPAFGDLKLLDSQHIADLIAYVMSLNPAQ